MDSSGIHRELMFSAESLFRWPSSAAICVIDANGAAEGKEKRTSLYNAREAGFIPDSIAWSLQAGDVASNDVVVVSLQQGQAEDLRRLLRDRNLRVRDATSVHGYEGSEVPVVVISTAPGNVSGKLALAVDVFRLKVAMTRGSRASLLVPRRWILIDQMGLALRIHSFTIASFQDVSTAPPAFLHCGQRSLSCSGLCLPIAMRSAAMAPLRPGVRMLPLTKLLYFFLSNACLLCFETTAFPKTHIGGSTFLTSATHMFLGLGRQKPLMEHIWRMKTQHPLSSCPSNGSGGKTSGGSAPCATANGGTTMTFEGFVNDSD